MQSKKKNKPRFEAKYDCNACIAYMLGNNNLAKAETLEIVQNFNEIKAPELRQSCLLIMKYLRTLDKT